MAIRYCILRLLNRCLRVFPNRQQGFPYLDIRYFTIIKNMRKFLILKHIRRLYWNL
jgi:hypothetical protein